MYVCMYVCIYMYVYKYIKIAWWSIGGLVNVALWSYDVFICSNTHAYKDMFRLLFVSYLFCANLTLLKLSFRLFEFFLVMCPKVMPSDAALKIILGQV